MLAKEAGRVRRPELANRLNRALDGGHLLLVAPAGFGKTMALAEALELRGEAVAWIGCTPADRDAGRLFGHLVEALRAAMPGLADALGERMAAGTEPVDAGLALRALDAELERLLIDPLTLVFDDAEQLEGAESAEAIVGQMLVSRAPRLHVAVASRRLPGAGADGWAGGSGLARIGPAELAFSVEECGELLRQRPAPEADEPEAVWEATEGWPLGVALAAATGAMSARGASDALSDQIAEELLGQLDAELRQAVIDTSVATHLDAETLRALRLPDAFLDELRSRGIPLREATGSDHRPSYHPLVREMLAALLRRETTREHRDELHARLARALDEAGRGEEAVEHWLAAGEPARAAAAVAEHGHALVTTAPATVEAWLEGLPREVLSAPPLLLLEGRLAVGRGRLEDAVAPLRDAVDACAKAGDEGAEWLARLALGDALVIQERFEEAIPLAEGFDSSPLPPAAMVGVVGAAALAGATRYAEAESMFDRAAAHPAGAAFAPFIAGFRAFWVDLLCGRLDAGLAGVREATGHLEREDPFQRLPYVMGMAAVIQDERGETETALATFADAERLARDTVLSGYIVDIAARFAAGVQAREGRADEAERALQRAIGTGLGWYAGDAEITRATIASHRGEHEQACELAGAAIDAGALEPWRSRWRNTALLAPVLVRSGRPAWARELVEDAIAARPPLASAARLLVLRGWLRSLEGDEAGALDDLTLGWEEAGESPAHLIRREAARIEPLLWMAAERRTLSPPDLVTALEAVAPGGEALLAFTRHPLPEMRRAALVAAAASGNPEAAGALRELEQDPDAAVAAAARASKARIADDPPPLAFRLLGGFGARRGSFEIPESAWERRIARRLVRYLLVHRGAAVTEDALFEAFWPDREPEQARRALQVAVSSARGVLDTPGAPASVLEVVERTYRLRLSDRDLVDADRYERAASAALGSDGAQALERLEAAAAHWGGDPLPEDSYEAWATVWRERLLDLHKSLLSELADARAELGGEAAAIDAARQAVELDPLDEGAQRRLMRGYARAGRRAHALRQYLECRRALVEELGVEPSQETAELQRRILAGETL